VFTSNCTNISYVHKSKHRRLSLLLKYLKKVRAEIAVPEQLGFSIPARDWASGDAGTHAPSGV
jgi:hypothetical protein